MYSTKRSHNLTAILLLQLVSLEMKLHILRLLIYCVAGRLSTQNMMYALPGDHVSHLENVGEDELDRLLGIVVDVENLFMCVHKVSLHFLIFNHLLIISNDLK